jgi:hypothetical protein
MEPGMEEKCKCRMLDELDTAHKIIYSYPGNLLLSFCSAGGAATADTWIGGVGGGGVIDS